MAFFSISTSQPLLSQISLRRRESREFRTMGQALGIPDSGVLAQSELVSVIDTNEPLDKLLLNKRFRHSFMAFADRLSNKYFSVFLFLGGHLREIYIEFTWPKWQFSLTFSWWTFVNNILSEWWLKTTDIKFAHSNIMDPWSLVLPGSESFGP